MFDFYFFKFGPFKICLLNCDFRFVAIIATPSPDLKKKNHFLSEIENVSWINKVI